PCGAARRASAPRRPRRRPRARRIPLPRPRGAGRAVGSVRAVSLAISVIIPTYRREAPLRRCLADLLAQRHPAFEVLVVDQSPDHEPETWAVLRALPPHAQHVRLPRPSVTAAVNVGVRMAKAPLLLFLDDDIEIREPALLARHPRHSA